MLANPLIVHDANGDEPSGLPDLRQQDDLLLQRRVLGALHVPKLRPVSFS